MILASAQGKNNAHIGRELGVKADTVRCWRMRWLGLQAVSRPISHWTGQDTADDVIARGMVPTISARHAARVCKKDLHPHLIRSWLTPLDDPQREGTIRTICQMSHDAPVLARQGERTRRTDE
jgi:hypothetical protein